MDAARNAGLVHGFEVATDDLERAVELVRATYSGTRMKISGDQDTFYYRQRTITAGPLALDAVTTPMDIQFECPSVDYLCFVATDQGQVDVRSGARHVELADGDTLLYPVGQTFTATARDLDTLLLRLPVGLVAARAGANPDRFRFTAMTPTSPALGFYFRATMEYVCQALQGPDTALAHPLVRAGVIDAVAGTALVAFPHNNDPAGDRLRRACPAAIRRAAAYIDANPAQPMTLAEIAAAARTDVRALQTGFRRHLGTTPMLYLRQVRLAHAHHDLQNADPTHGDDVATIARRWGFGHLGRFAGFYRATYGHSPHHTLHS
ncbi:helix-turn-helix transcriptional regulator [Actinoplanes sp. NPDC049118]|uniref:helix-turn-helix transcriptional regulator n=1 Tax=Actinoplanes sp. NPDC049118 TaxID=3155769 RepID=UPI0033DCEA65